jgi:hypothetical protein
MPHRTLETQQKLSNLFVVSPSLHVMVRKVVTEDSITIHTNPDHSSEELLVLSDVCTAYKDGVQCDLRYLALSKVVTATGFTGAAIRLVLDQVESTDDANSLNFQMSVRC